MQLGMIGLGRMGANMVRRLQKNGHQCVIYDRSADAVKQLAGDGATPSSSLDDFVKKLQKPRAVWLMVPAGVVDATLHDLVGKLESGDIIIDGGNSYYIDDIRRTKELKLKGIHYVDVGTSGGIWGLERGYCMMIGGEAEAVKHLDPVFASSKFAWLDAAEVAMVMICPTPASEARRSTALFAINSSYSDWGELSATMPPPAW